MSENKKYYWLKLKADFFDDDTIQFIEEQEKGVYYVNFYLKLCLKSIGTNGKLMRLVGTTLLPYDIKSLAKLTRTDVDTVAVAMQLFERIGLVERLETGEIYMSQINEMIGSETNKAELMRRKRAEEKKRQQAISSGGNNVTQMLPERYPEIEKEKEIEIDIDIEREIEKENAVPTGPAAPTTRIPYERIKDLYNSTCKSLPSCKVMSDARKKAIKARFHSGYTIDDFKTLFAKAEASSFLKGKNDRNWMASFDWLIKDANAAKVLDGNYDDHGNKQAQGKERLGDLDDLF